MSFEITGKTRDGLWGYRLHVRSGHVNGAIAAKNKTEATRKVRDLHAKVTRRSNGEAIPLSPISRKAPEAI